MTMTLQQIEQARDYRRITGKRMSLVHALRLVRAIEEYDVETFVATGLLPTSITIRTLWPACSCCGPERDVMFEDKCLTRY
jgi:hypothetical protein